jgi:hypothetical protein
MVQAILGKEIHVQETVLFDSVNASQISYVCKGTTLDFGCVQVSKTLLCNRPQSPRIGSMQRRRAHGGHDRRSVYCVLLSR